MLTGSSRHNTGFVGDLLEFYKPVYAVCYPSIILLHHMVFPRILQHQTGRQEKTRTPIHHNYECLLEERNCLKTLISMIAVCSAESLQSCLTLCDPIDCSLPGSSVYEILQGRTHGVGCHGLLQGIFPTQGSSLCLLSFLRCRQIINPQNTP